MDSLTAILRDKTARLGLIGTAIAALCCFTPVLILLFTAVGIGWIIGYLDYVLLPALAFFVGLTLYALWKRSRALEGGNAHGSGAGTSRQALQEQQSQEEA
ncbi:MAG: mercury resistance system transport protein MerF [Caldilineaceae bacterium]|nr:mercury resistance system transport protein MerF [Caldilineaceae bacterium]